jgi:hypothetical protein
MECFSYGWEKKGPLLLSAVFDLLISFFLLGAPLKLSEELNYNILFMLASMRVTEPKLILLR